MIALLEQLMKMLRDSLPGSFPAWPILSVSGDERAFKTLGLSSTFLSTTETLAVPQRFSVNIQSGMAKDISQSNPQSLPHSCYGN